MPEAFASVTCPTCFAVFEVAGPSLGEIPVEWDCDCEVCCRPMVIAFTCDDDEIVAEARAISD